MIDYRPGGQERFLTLTEWLSADFSEHGFMDTPALGLTSVQVRGVFWGRIPLSCYQQLSLAWISWVIYWFDINLCMGWMSYIIPNLRVWGKQIPNPKGNLCDFQTIPCAKSNLKVYYNKDSICVPKNILFHREVTYAVRILQLGGVPYNTLLFPHPFVDGCSLHKIFFTNCRGCLNALGDKHIYYELIILVTCYIKI